MGRTRSASATFFFFAQLCVGLAALLPGRRALAGALATLTPGDRWLLVAHAFLGMFLGPVAYYLALQSLSVISQTLLFALVLPASALLARWLLQEPLPRAFWLSLTLIASGLLLPKFVMAAMGGPMDALHGLCWGLVGLILIYALSLNMGRELALRLAYRLCSVATVSLWGSLTIVVAVISAALLLSEPIDAAQAAGIVLLLGGVCLGSQPAQSDPSLRRYNEQDPGTS